MNHHSNPEDEYGEHFIDDGEIVIPTIDYGTIRIPLDKLEELRIAQESEEIQRRLGILDPVAYPPDQA